MSSLSANKYTKWADHLEVVSVRPYVRQQIYCPKLVNGFRWNLVLRTRTGSCRISLMYVFMSYRPIITTTLREIQIELKISENVTRRSKKLYFIDYCKIVSWYKMRFKYFWCSEYLTKCKRNVWSNTTWLICCALSFDTIKHRGSMKCETKKSISMTKKYLCKDWCSWFRIFFSEKCKTGTCTIVTSKNEPCVFMVHFWFYGVSKLKTFTYPDPRILWH